MYIPSLPEVFTKPFWPLSLTCLIVHPTLLHKVTAVKKATSLKICSPEFRILCKFESFEVINGRVKRRLMAHP